MSCVLSYPTRRLPWQRKKPEDVVAAAAAAVVELGEAAG
jgi:hypothetical protein